MEDTLTAEEVVSMKLLGTAEMIVFLLAAISLNFNMSLIMTAVIELSSRQYCAAKNDQKRLHRDNKLRKSLPDFLDLVKSVTEAGLSIQEALNKVAEKQKVLWGRI